MASRSGSRPCSTLRVILVAIQTALIPLSATAADFYVNPSTGSNGNNGLSPGTAWKTITFGLTQAPAGATLNLASGVYDATNGEVFPLTLDQGTNLMGSGMHNTTIDARGTSAVNNLFVTGGLSQTTHIRDLHVHGGRAGIEFNQANVNISSVMVTDTTFIGLWSSGLGETIFDISDVLILDCAGGAHFQLDTSGRFSDSLIANSLSDCIQLFADERGSPSVEVESCILLNGLGSGYSASETIARFNSMTSSLVAGSRDNIHLANFAGVLANNTTVRHRAVGVFLFEETFVEIDNNIFLSRENDTENLLFWEVRSNSDPTSYRNNLLFGTPHLYRDENTITYSTEFEINNLVANGTAPVEDNIVADPLFIGGPTRTNTGIQYDSNSFLSILTDSSATWQPNKFKGAILYPNIDENTFAYYIVENDTTTVRVWGDITDASFAATVVGATYEIVDYHLSRFSPAVDAGYTAGVDLSDLDLDGNPRVAGTDVDIGAYEFAQLPVLPSPTVTPTPTTTPTSTATATVTNTNTEVPTWTSIPTYTPYPTYTEAPTCAPEVTHAPGDLTGDGEADVEDLLEFIKFWDP